MTRYQPGKFTEGLEKHTDGVIMTSFRIFGFRNFISCGSNFTEAGISTKKTTYNIIMASFHNILFLKLHILQNIIQAIML